MDEKRQIIGKLYALRAGLSLIHDENKKIKAKESAITKIDETVQGNNKKIEDSRKRVYDGKLKIEKYKSDLNDDNRKISANKREIFFNITHLIMLLIGAVAGAVSWFVSSFVDIALFGGEHDTTGVEAVPWIIGGTILGLIVSLLFSYIQSKKEIQSTERSRDKNSTDLYNAQNALDNNEELIDDLSKKNKSLANDRINAVAEYNTEKDIVVPVVKSMFDALLNQYSSLLDSRDWKNLDLIIFYLETGRADTIKEALSHVDRQNQMDRLTEAINEASATICKTLERSFASLENCINENFENLSYQLSKQHREQMGALKGIGSSLNSISSRVDQISVNSAMQTSLLNNININSNELANVATHIYEYGVKSY